MNIQDLQNIESRLALLLPDAYRELLLKGVTLDGSLPEPYLKQEVKELLITNLQLRMTPRKDAFAGAAWPSKYVCIGDDGCGNYYCIAADDPGCEVFLFDHDENAFMPVSGNLREYIEYISNLFESVAAIKGNRADSLEVPKKATPSDDAVISRTDDPRESVLNPISLEEWTAFVAADADLEMRGYARMINRFTNEERRFDWPGMAVLHAGKKDHEFIYAYGQISVRKPDRTALKKLKQVAASLNAKLITDAG